MYTIVIIYVVFLSFVVSSISAQVVCPNAATYSPCECIEYTGAQAFVFVTSKLHCSNKNLSDSKVNEILTAFTSNPLVSPINQLILYGNQLTRVPENITQFRYLTFVNINNNNIPSVELAAFNFYTEKLNLIDLSDNQITNIESNAFQGIFLSNIFIIMTINQNWIIIDSGIYINYSKIFLDKNKMTRFDSEVFRPVLEQMAPHPEFPGSYISIGNSMNTDWNSLQYIYLNYY
jgi:hypothetical protein